jgi:hypothetical protein
MAAPLACERPFRRLEGALLWLIGFSGGFVVIEPAPYEFVVALAMATFFATGLVLRPVHLPLIFLLLICNFGYLIGAIPVLSANGVAAWIAVSCFMAATTLFFAFALGEDTARRLDRVMNGYMAVAVLISVFGIVTYFHLLPGSNFFIFAERSRATFKDPNVLAAFLVLPAMLALQRTTTGRLRDFLVGGFALTVLAIELLLAFSRGAWIACSIAATIWFALACITASSTKDRLRLFLFAAGGLLALAMVLVAAVSVPQVASVLTERASLIQSYDAGRFGRFGRHILGAEVALHHPLGIGPLQFSKFFPEDPHNSFLDSFMAGGWISGSTYIALILATLILGLRFAILNTPWRRTYIAIYATFIALTGESYVIDVEHWRHYFLILGVLWGLFAAASRRQFAPAAASAFPRLQPA